MKFWHSFLTSMSVQTSEFLNILATLFNIMTEYGLKLASYKNDKKKHHEDIINVDLTISDSRVQVKSHSFM